MQQTPSVTLKTTEALDEGAARLSRLGLLGRALHHRNYRLFFAGQIISLVGTFLTQVATVWLVYSLTKSARQLGLVAFIGQIPMFAIGPFAGVWVDRVRNRRQLLVMTQSLAMAQSLTLAVLALSHHISVPLIMVLALFQGLVNALDMPTRQAFLVEMITDRADLPNAIALNSTMVHAARLIGPALAGLLIHWVGEGYCFLIDGVSYIAVIAALLAMRLQPRVMPSPRSVLVELTEGFKYVWNFTPIRALLLLMAIFSLTGMPAFSTLMPIFADYFGGKSHGAQTLGFLMGASGGGAMLGALYLASRRTVLGLGRLIAVGAICFGLALVAFSFSRHLALSLMIVPVGGCAMLIEFAGANTLLQTLADDDKRGRVMSFFTVSFVGMTPFGNYIAGELASRLSFGATSPAEANFLGASRTLLIAGIICMVVAVGFMRKLPNLRKIIRPIYVRKGILPREVAVGVQTAAEITEGGAT